MVCLRSLQVLAFLPALVPTAIARPHLSLTQSLAPVLDTLPEFQIVSSRNIVRDNEFVTRADTLTFASNNINLKNARVGDSYSTKVYGLLQNEAHIEIEYSLSSKVKGDWLKISADGVLSGTPPQEAGGETVYLTVQSVSTADRSVKAELGISIPVVEAESPLVKELRVLSYNLWNGGINMKHYHIKQVVFLAATNVDIVILEEATDGHAKRLADALDWHFTPNPQDSVAVISRYPILEVFGETDHGKAVSIDLGDENRQINVWGVHLGYTPYGPYDFCFDNMTVPQVMKREDQSKRGPQIRETVGLMEDQIANAKQVPVLLAGDFNAPSHLDWIDETKESHCGVGDVPWPTSKVPTDAGLTDAYRVAHPDPKARPGNTWSPTFVDNEGRPEPMDRIDFIYHAGNVKVLSAQELVVGKPKPQPDHADNLWTSDHRALLVHYSLT